ncbi:helix-turn-helix domain-containing protein [Enterococcus silesiacus]|nr:helix-turn-helix domain-containing protein [Enterococcus silesiacus]
MSEPFQKELGIKMGKSTFSQYVNGKQSPDQDRIYLLSKTLNVNEPWLMGYDVAKERIPDEKRDTLNSKNDISSIYNNLSESRQSKVYDFARQQLEEQNKIKEFPLPKKIDTLAAHSADPEKVYTDDEVKNIHSYLDKLDDEYDSKHKK